MIRSDDGKWLDTSVFREAAIHFMRHGHYCSEPWGSDRWFDYWYEQRRRCIDGYEVEGERITGDHYFYLNFCPIQKVEDASSKKSKKVKGFPDFWDGDYNYFWCREIARNGITEEGFKRLKLFVKIRPEHLGGGYNFIIAKSRRKGYSYKSAAIAAKNFFCIPNSLTILAAEDKKFLYPKGLFSMAYDYISFINSNTAWVSPSDVINKPAQGHIKSSYIEYVNGIKVESGFKSEILSLSFGDNPDAARGKDSYDIFFEESGSFGSPGLLKNSYFATLDCVKAGNIKTGMISAYGCVCKGTKVWLPNGRIANIEDITQDTGIVGYASRGVISESIPYIQPPTEKECFRIITRSGNSIECSKDHPLLTRLKINTATFKRAEDLCIGDYLLKSKQMPIFGEKRMWHPRLVGLLIGDGYYGSYHTSSQLCVSEKEILDYIDSLGMSYRFVDSKSSDEPYFRYITLHHTQEEMRLLGIQGQSKLDKRLPCNIWEYSKNDIAELLGGLFDSDGYVSKQHGRRMRITLTSTVRELLEEVKIQLYKLGIKAAIYDRTHKSGTTLKSNVTGKTSILNTKRSYSLEIKDKFSLRNFKKHIRLLVNKKQSRLDSYTLGESFNEPKTTYEYVHTIEKGEYFISNPKMEYLEKDKIVSIEDIGLQPIYNLSTGVSHTYITNEFISHNTSGDISGGTADYANMFERPEAFEFLPFENIWDDGAEGQLVGFFHPVNWNMEGFYDKEGNSDFAGAKASELSDREKLIAKGATSVEMQKRLQEKPLGPGEAFASVSINNFPVVELRRQLQKVKALPRGVLKGVPVELVYDGGDVIAKPIMDGSKTPITSFHNVPNDRRGCIVVYEQPVSDAPKGLYKIGYDPVRQDAGTSLASIIVYKGVHKYTQNKNLIVAEYIGRLDSAEDIDMYAEKLAIYYNTTIMHENEVSSVKNYFRRIKRLDLLAAQPDNVISANIRESKVARVYGCHMNDKLKDAGERYIKDWLLEVCDFDEHGSPIRNLDNLYSTRILEELISYNRRGNFDMVSALIMCLIQVQEEALDTVYGEPKVNKNAKKLLELMENMYR